MDLKAVKPFLIIHKQLEREHPVVAYFGEATPSCVRTPPPPVVLMCVCVCTPCSAHVCVCVCTPRVVLLYAVQEGIKVSKSPEGKTYLFKSMDKLDTV